MSEGLDADTTEQGGTPGPRSPRAGRAAVLGLIAILVGVLAIGIPMVGRPSATPAPGTSPAAGASQAASTPPTPANPSSSSAAAAETARPTPAAAAEPAASSSPSPVAWTALDLPPLDLVAELTPDDADAAGPDPATTFTLRSLVETPAVTLAKGLAVDPPVRLVVARGPDPSRAVIRPASPLERGTTYRFTLAAPDGSLAGGWAFNVASPPRVVGVIPSHQTTGVPVDTGIEIAFDRDGVADPTRWFSITPHAKGRFERHDRTWVFVPDALAPSTVYDFTLRAGVPLEGSELALAHPVRVSFQTAGPQKERPVSLQALKSVVETSTDEAPVIGVSVTSFGAVRPPKDVSVTLYRVADARAASTIASALIDREWWGDAPRDAVATAGLHVAARLKVPLVLDPRDGYAGALRFPGPLQQGWYLADLPDDIAAGQQVLVQVTPVAAYAVMAPGRTLVWVNRIGTGPIAGATVRLATGATIGVTGSDGLVLATTPPEVAASIDPEQPWRAPHPILVVEAHGVGAVIAPIGTSASREYGSDDWNPSAGVSAPDLLSTLATDRDTFRRTDSIAAWGMVRDPATGESPRTVTLDLAPIGADEYGWGPDEPPRAPIATAEATTSPLGVFTTTIDVTDLPLGSYLLSLSADGIRLSSHWITIGIVRKPAYRLDVTVDHRAVMAGDPVVVTGEAAFYDGTPVRGLPVRISGPGQGEQDIAPVTTGPDGRASTTVRPAYGGSADVSTAGPELGQVASASIDVRVFPSALDVSIESADIVGEAVRLTGAVRSVDLAAVEASMAAGDSWPERVGPPAGGVRVAATVRATAWVARRTGTAYDFVLKKTVPIYAYDERELQVTSGVVRSDAAGRFTATVRLPREARGLRAQVEVAVTVTDPQGRQDAASSYAERAAREPASTAHPVWLDPGPADAPEYSTLGCGLYWAWEEYKLGETVRLTFRDDAGPLPAGPSRRFLFLTARDTIRDATLSTSAVFRRAFTASELPGFAVLGVAFDGRMYRAAVTPVHVSVDPTTRSIVVRVTTDLAPGKVHEPGEPAWVRISTGDIAGHPVAADVVVRAIDEKLYDAGVAWDGEELWYESRYASAMLLGTFASHQLPGRTDTWGCGSTTGGGGGGGGLGSVRADFRDRVLFARVRTGPDGTVRVPFQLSDDLTAWRVTATAVADDLRTGIGRASIPVGLPFFVEPVAADTVVAMDAPGIVLRAYGSALRTGDVVHYTVRAPTLAAAPVDVDAAAFTSGVAWLSRVGTAMPLGIHRVVVEGTVRTGGRTLRDAKEMTIQVVSARNGIRTTRVVAVSGDTRPPGGDDALTTCTIADAGRASVVPLLDRLTRGGPRADQAAAAAAARDLLAEELGIADRGGETTSFDPAPYLGEWRGITLLPYSSPDLELTTLVALGAPNVFPRDNVEPYLMDVVSSSGEPRERRLIAAAGLAALGLPVLADLQDAAAAGDLTVAERVWLAVGLAEAGDLARAAAIERALLAELGQRSGAWARVVTGSMAHSAIESTALLAIAAARIGDPLAPDLEAYVLDAVDTEAVHSLEEVAYAQRALERLPRPTARVAYTIEGQRHKADLGPHRSVQLVLTPSQRAETVVRALAGAASIACSWDAPVAGADLPRDASISVTRSVQPQGPIPAGSLVTIRLTVVVGPLAPSGFYRVVETLPAGLAPTNDWVMERAAAEGDADSEAPHEQTPWVIEGNRVEWGFWWGGRTSGDQAVLRVTARVVAPGGYQWEPAVVQLESAPGVGAATEPTGIVVNAP